MTKRGLGDVEWVLRRVCWQWRGMRTTTKCTPFLDSLLSLQTQTTSLDWLQSVKLRRRRGTLPRRAVIGSRQRRLWQENPDAHRLRAIRATTPSGSRSENPSTSTSTALLLVTWIGSCSRPASSQATSGEKEHSAINDFHGTVAALDLDGNRSPGLEGGGSSALSFRMNLGSSPRA